MQNYHDEIEETKSFFEYQNKVTESGGPSNVDVTLLGEYTKVNDRKVILFLESKFAEYILDSYKTLEIRREYLKPNTHSEPLYHDEFWNTIKIGVTEDMEKKSLYCHQKPPCILQVLKQMISHYVGVRRFADGVNDNNINSQNFYHSEMVNKQLLQKEVREFAMQLTNPICLKRKNVLLNNKIISVCKIS